ncbi:MAG: serine protease [Rhodospirillales bacterium]|nr:serine protease [Rhodospirillales bacterium]
MALPQDWEINTKVQPKPESYAFDLDRALMSVVSLRAQIHDDAFTAQVLGTVRDGNAVLVGNSGLAITVGYLITEAETVWLVSHSGKVAPGHVVASDSETGFGLVQVLGTLDAVPLEFGSSADLRIGDPVVVAGAGGRRRSVAASVIAKREFAGYWEYLLDEGLFTAPPHPNWGGTALIGADGKLAGIGSLFIQQAHGGEAAVDGNMIIPIDILKPVLDDLQTMGRINKSPRPWLGLYTTENDDRLVVAGVARGGPAQKADVRTGDMVMAVGGEPVRGLASMFRRIWSLGSAGVHVPMTVLRDGVPVEIDVRSGARGDFLKAPRLH